MNHLLHECPLSLPELYHHIEPTRSEKNTTNKDSLQGNNRKDKKSSKGLKNSVTQRSSATQLTLTETWKKSGVINSNDVLNEKSTGVPSRSSPSESATCSTSNLNESVDTDIEISEAVKLLEAQRYKFRPLLLDCFSILSYSKVKYQSIFSDRNNITYITKQVIQAESAYIENVAYMVLICI